MAHIVDRLLGEINNLNEFNSPSKFHIPDQAEKKSDSQNQCYAALEYANDHVVPESEPVAPMFPPLLNPNIPVPISLPMLSDPEPIIPVVPAPEPFELPVIFIFLQDTQNREDRQLIMPLITNGTPLPDQELPGQTNYQLIISQQLYEWVIYQRHHDLFINYYTLPQSINLPLVTWQGQDNFIPNEDSNIPKKIYPVNEDMDYYFSQVNEEIENTDLSTILKKETYWTSWKYWISQLEKKYLGKLSDIALTPTALNSELRLKLKDAEFLVEEDFSFRRNGDAKVFVTRSFSDAVQNNENNVNFILSGGKSVEDVLNAVINSKYYKDEHANKIDIFMPYALTKSLLYFIPRAHWVRVHIKLEMDKTSVEIKDSLYSSLSYDFKPIFIKIKNILTSSRSSSNQFYTEKTTATGDQSFLDHTSCGHFVIKDITEGIPTIGITNRQIVIWSPDIVLKHLIPPSKIMLHNTQQLITFTKPSLPSNRNSAPSSHLLVQYLHDQTNYNNEGAQSERLQQVPFWNIAQFYLKTIIYHSDVIKFHQILKKHGISKETDVLQDHSEFKKSVWIKLHPDKGGDANDFTFANNLKEKFGTDLDVNNLIQDSIPVIQLTIHKIVIGFKVLDTGIDIAKLVHQPTVGRGIKVAIDFAHLAIMHYGFRYFPIINALNIPYQLYQGQHLQACYVASSIVVGYGGPYIALIYGASTMVYTGYNAIHNSYSFYQEYHRVVKVLPRDTQPLL